MSAPVTPQDFPEIRWHGHWIWVPEEPVEPGGFLSAAIDPHAKEAHGLFRKTVRIDRVPERVPARITADSRYALFANGQEVFRGPIRSQPRRLQYDLFDLAPYLRPGENVLAIYVKYYGTPKSYWMPAVPNLTLGKTGILVFEANLGEESWLVSDATWKARKADAWSDDHGWGIAQVVPAMHIGGFAHTQPPTDPYGPLYPRPIARLGGEVRTTAAVRVEMIEGQVDAG